MNQENVDASAPEKPGIMPLIVVAIIVIASAGGYIAYNAFLQPENYAVEAKIVVDFGNGTVLSEDAGFKNNTPLGMLQEFVGPENVVDSGGFVTSINGVASNDDVPEFNSTDEPRYWLFYVNGTMPMDSAALLEVHDGDLVEFKFEVSPW